MALGRVCRLIRGGLCALLQPSGVRHLRVCKDDLACHLTPICGSWTYPVWAVGARAVQRESTGNPDRRPAAAGRPSSPNNRPIDSSSGTRQCHRHPVPFHEEVFRRRDSRITILDLQKMRPQSVAPLALLRAGAQNMPIKVVAPEVFLSVHLERPDMSYG